MGGVLQHQTIIRRYITMVKKLKVFVKGCHQLIQTIGLVVLSYSAFSQIQTDVPALKDVFANDFYIGCLLSYRHVALPTDPVVPGQSAALYPNGDGGYLIKFHMNSMSPGNNMKPQYTVDIAACSTAYANAQTDAQRDSINLHPVVRFNADLIAQLNWAKRQGFTFRGHTLVWYNQTPGTAFFRRGYRTDGERLTKEEMTIRMENYIKEVIRLIHENWPGMLSAMDVVNEAVEENGTDRINNNEWYTTFGDNSYIFKAFELTRKYTELYGETQMKLYYNDYNTHNSSKANGIVRICGPIFRAGYLDGIGMQDHDALTYPTAEQWIASYNKFDTICTEMAVTELDVSTNSGTNYPSDAILAQQANQYAQLFKCFVERSYRSGRGKIISVSKDGLNDQYTFVTNQSTSLWNTQNQCKPAFYAVVRVGIYYNKLDSLIKIVDTLKQQDYTTDSWEVFETSLNSAKAVKSSNFSRYVSADTALMNAFYDLKAAYDKLVPVVNSVANSNNLPQHFTLHQNYPNPFNPTTNISYELSNDQALYTVTLKVYDVLGKEVATIVNQKQTPGIYIIEFNAHSLPNGVYYYRLQANNYVATKKMIVLK